MYTLKLTEADFDTINFVGGRYEWSLWLMHNCEPGVNELQEHQAWDFHEAAAEDAKGGHSYFPMLDNYSDLYEKLQNFLDGIV